VAVTLGNDAQVLPVDFTITAEAEFSAARTVEAGGTETVDVPPDAAGLIVVQADHQTIRTGGWEDPGGCPTSAPPTTTPPSGDDDDDGDDGGGADESGDDGGTATGSQDGGHPSTGTRSSRGGSRTAAATPTPSPTTEETTEPEGEELDALGDPVVAETPPAPALAGRGHEDDPGWGDTAVLVFWIVAAFAVVCLVGMLINSLRRRRGQRRYERYVSPFADFH
jgi:hypothetical protein